MTGHQENLAAKVYFWATMVLAAILFSLPFFVAGCARIKSETKVLCEVSTQKAYTAQTTASAAGWHLELNAEYDNLCKVNHGQDNPT